MYLYKQKLKDGDIYLSIKDKYHVPGKGTRERTIEKVDQKQMVYYSEKYDGYYSIVTSELNMSDRDMREVYRGLAKIEDSFKVTKTCFQSRPVYVWLNEHIEAHFATCFLSLVLVRLLGHKLGNRYPTARILNSLKKYNCVHLDANSWRFTYYDEILDACGAAFGMKLNGKYKTRQEIQRLLRY